MKNKVYDLIWQYDENHVAVKQATKQGFILCEYGGVADLSFPTSKIEEAEYREMVRFAQRLCLAHRIFTE